MKSTALGGERESGLADKLRALGRKRERRELALRLVDHVRALMDKNLEDLAERLTEILHDLSSQSRRDVIVSSCVRSEIGCEQLSLHQLVSACSALRLLSGVN